MPFKRDRDDYVDHNPKSNRSSTYSATTNPPQFTWLEMIWMTIVSLSYFLGYAIQISIIVERYDRSFTYSATTNPPQFTWLEMIWMTIVSLSYLLGYAIQISIIVERYSQEERPQNCGLYVAFFVLPHVMAGIKNLQYFHRETVEDEEDGLGQAGPVKWLIHVIFLPFSPLIRFVRAWRFGLKEKHDWEYGIRYVNEMVTAGVLRLFEVFLGDGPTLCLLLRDDVWGRSDDWSVQIMGPPNILRFGPMYQPEGTNPIAFWTVFRMIFLLSKMAQCVTFYLVIVKRLQRIQFPEQYRHLKGTNSKQGRLNFFATLILYTAHFFFIGKINYYFNIQHSLYYGPLNRLIQGTTESV